MSTKLQCSRISDVIYVHVHKCWTECLMLFHLEMSSRWQTGFHLIYSKLRQKRNHIPVRLYWFSRDYWHTKPHQWSFVHSSTRDREILACFPTKPTTNTLSFFLVAVVVGAIFLSRSNNVGLANPDLTAEPFRSSKRLLHWKRRKKGKPQTKKPLIIQKICKHEHKLRHTLK